MRLPSNHPVATVSLFATLVLAGFLAMRTLPVELLPSLKYPRLVVVTTFANASSEEVESLLTRQVEEALSTVLGLKSIYSVSSEGVSSVTLTLHWGANVSLAAAEAREKLDMIADQLPREAKLPTVVHYDPSERPVVTLAVTGWKDLAAMRLLARQRIKTELETLNGVAAVRISGGLVPEVQVLVDQGRLTAQGLDIREVAARIEQANINFPGGRVLQGSFELPVRTVGRFRNVDEMSSLSLGRGHEGGAVRLKDIAVVREGHQERTAICRVNGKPAVLIGIIKEPSSNALEVSRRVHARTEDLRRTLPSGIQLNIVEDEAPLVEDTLRHLKIHMIAGSCLAFLVLLVTLRRLTSALLILISIPVSVVSTLGFMALAGVSLNFMSIGGLALGAGMLMDASIVVLESIHRQRLREPDIHAAVESALREVGSSVVAGTLAILAVLAPILFLSGMAQKLFRDFAFTLAVSLVISLLTATILLPAIIGWTRREGSSPADGPEGRSRFESGYRVSLSWVQRHPLFIALFCAALFGCSSYRISQCGLELIPDVNVGRFVLHLTLPPDTGIDGMEHSVNTVEKWIQECPDVEGFVTEAGSDAQQSGMDQSQTAGKANEARITVRLKPEGSGFRSPEPTMRVLRGRSESLPNASVDFVLRQGFLARVLGHTESPELLRLAGDELSILRSLGDRLVEALGGSASLRDVRCAGNTWVDQVRVVSDRDRAAAAGVSVEDVAQVVRASVGGKVAGKFIRKEDESDIRVRLKPEDLHGAEGLRQIPVSATSGRMVHLEQVAQLQSGTGPREIIRSERRRSVIIHANVVGKAFSQAEAEARHIAQSLDMPAGYEARPGAELTELSASVGTMLQAVGLALVLVYVVLAIQFESFRWPFVVFASVPMTIAGPALMLTLTGYSISVLVLIGTVMLVGIVVNNAILIVASINLLRGKGQEPASAIIDGASVRLRPVLMTTCATVFGALPLCVAWGGAAPFNRPLALTVVTGLLSSTLFTLFLVPLVYRIFAWGRPSMARHDDGESL